MNNDDLRDGARVVALTAIVNLLIRELDRHGRARIQNDLLSEVERVADGNETMVAFALDYIDQTMTELKLT